MIYGIFDYNMVTDGITCNASSCKENVVFKKSVTLFKKTCAPNHALFHRKIWLSCNHFLNGVYSDSECS